jgi:hypothetical protein
VSGVAPVANWWERLAPDPGSRLVFVSHATHDGAAAQQVVRTLESAGLRCWIAPRDIPPGRSWANAIVDGIGQCRVLVVLVSARSMESPEVQREVGIASREGKHMLSVRLDRRAELTGPMAYFLGPLQWIDATARPLGPQLDPLPAAVGQLLGMPVSKRRTAAPKRRRRDEDDGRGSPSLDELLRRGPRSR